MLAKSVCLIVLVLGLSSFSNTASAVEAVGTACPTSITQRNGVLDPLHLLGTQLALGRICLVQEETLHLLKNQTLNRYAGCFQAFQVKATEIQDALEAGRTGARDTYKQAKNKTTLCEEVRMASR